MTHKQALPESDCPGFLIYQGSGTSRRTTRAGVIDFVLTRYQCMWCDEEVFLTRRCVEPPEGQVAPLVELRFDAT